MKRVARFAGLALLTACGSHARSPDSTPGVIGLTAYDVAIEQNDSEGLELAVSASFPEWTNAELSVTEGAEPFVKDVRISEHGANSFHVIEKKSDGSWYANECASGCDVRYRFLLTRAGQEIDEDDIAMSSRNLAEAPPSAWLLRPMQIFEKAPVHLHVVSHVPDVIMATGLRRARSGEAGAYDLTQGELPITPYTVFGKLRVQEIDAGKGAHIQFAIGPGKSKSDDAALKKWIQRSAFAVTDFYGQFPIDNALVVAIPSRGDDVGFGRTMAGGGGSILINVGRSADDAALASDWVATHEMIHLAFPSMGGEHRWIEEGLATYLEPLVRVRAGMTDERAVWYEFLTMIQNGLPQEGDRGLDRTRTWGRVYWGGALFCLLADLEIRERSKNTRALDDAVRGILRAGGDDSARWTMDYAFEQGDRATGLTVLHELYAKMAFAPLPVDLDAIWKKLGVSLRGREVIFDDTAPEADIRKAMTARR
jgi:predicted metalloprotease with PDZ domain